MSFALRATSPRPGRAVREVCKRWVSLAVIAVALTGCPLLPVPIEKTPLASQAGTSDQVVLRDANPPPCQNLTPALGMFVDTKDAWRIDELLAPGAQPPFEPVAQGSVNKGFVGDPVWLRFQLRNESGSDQHFVLEITNPRLARVEFYHQEDDGRIVLGAGGAAVRKSERAVLQAEPAFEVDLAPGAVQTYYLSIRNSGSLRFSALLWREDSFTEQGLLTRALVFVLIGSLAAMTIYHLIICLILRERAYFYLAMMTLLFGVYQFARTGLGGLMLWPDTPYWSTHSVVTLIMMVTAAATFFVDAFLDAGRKNPKLSLFLRMLGWANIVSGLFGLTDLMFKYYLSHTVGVITATTVLAVVLLQLRSGAPAARTFIIGWGFTLLSAIVFALLGPGYLPSNLITENFVEFSLLSAAVLCSIALAERVKGREAEQRQQLERAVAERTAELEAALDEVKNLSGLLPICSHCKKIRDDKGYWNSLEKYLYEHTDAVLSHGICPDCAAQHYPEIFGKARQERPTGE